MRLCNLLTSLLSELLGEEEGNLSHIVVRLGGGVVSKVHLLLRPLLCNCSDQEVGKMAQRPAKSGVEQLPTGVGRHLGRQAAQQAAERLGPVPLQAEEVLELPDHSLDELPFARRPPARLLRPRPLGRDLRRGYYQCAMVPQPSPLPLNRGETFVGEEGVVPVGRNQEVAYGPLVAVGRRESEGNHDPFRVHRKGHLEAVHPLGLGYAAAEGGLSGEETLTTGSDPNQDRDQGGVQHVVDLWTSASNVGRSCCRARISGSRARMRRFS